MPIRMSNSVWAPDRRDASGRRDVMWVCGNCDAFVNSIPKMLSDPRMECSALIYFPVVRGNSEGWNMKRFASIVLAAILMQPALSLAADKSTDSRPKPSSFVPHAKSNTHVYGTPIQPALVGSKTSHHKHTPKKPASNPKK